MLFDRIQSYGLCALFLAAAGASAQSFAVLPGQRVLFSGDSITKGYGFGNYTDPSPLRTIYGITTILAQENLPHPPAFIRPEQVWAGRDAAGNPKTIDSLAGEIHTWIRRGDIRTGDWLIYEDAGQVNQIISPGPSPHLNDLYGRYRRNLRGMIEEADRSIGRQHILLMTMFDYNPRIPWCQWEVPLDDGKHTANDAIRDEAASLGVRVIDMRRIMNQAHQYLQARGWGRTVGPDGIHPNIFGNTVMAFAILGALGADLGRWKVDTLAPHFRTPEAGGDVTTIWGFTRNPNNDERVRILRDLQAIVAQEMPTAILEPPTQTSQRILRHGRILDRPAQQPAGTTRPVVYEIGKLFQLDRERVLLTTGMREQGGHDFEVGNDGIVFRQLSDLVPQAAFPVNRLDPNYRMKDGRPSVLARFPVSGGFLPQGAVDAKEQLYAGHSTGFFLGAAYPYTPDRQDNYPGLEPFLTFQQARWDGSQLHVTDDQLPEPLASRLINVGFNCLFDNGAFLCPAVTPEGIIVIRFDYRDRKWQPVAWGKPFRSSAREIEPSLRKTPDGYLIYTRGAADRRGRLYRSIQGLDYYLASEHWNLTVPQSLNEGLDGSLYLTTNPGPGMLRNPLLAYDMRGMSFVEPKMIHDEKQIGDDKEKEVPFVDHGIGFNVHLGGRWRHLLLYRVCDLRETNGDGAPPRPQTGLYLAEKEYDTVTAAPFRFR